MAARKNDYDIAKSKDAILIFSVGASRKRRVNSYHECIIARSQPSESCSSRRKGGEGCFLLSVPQDSSERDGWERGHRMALSSGSPVSEDVWALIKMCRASGDATPTSTTDHLFLLFLILPPPLLLLLHRVSFRSDAPAISLSPPVVDCLFDDLSSPFLPDFQYDRTQRESQLSSFVLEEEEEEEEEKKRNATWTTAATFRAHTYTHTHTRC